MIFNLTTPAVSKLPKFTYTGNYELIEDGGGNWRIKFLTSGIFTPAKGMSVDVFLVGGGGGGRSITGSGGGGGGGYTTTVLKTSLTASTEYTVTIGAGGGNLANGGATSFGSYSAAGGKNPGAMGGVGGAGGSGGGGYITSSPYTGYAGGSDGSDGVSGGGSTPGKGQGTTTREFGESTGDLYAGGGGGNSAYSGGQGAGGDGGGGAGGQSGTPNTGGGAGGGGSDVTGGSGIAIIRNARG